MPESTPGEVEPVVQSSKGDVIHARFFTTRNLSVIVTGGVAIVALYRADPKDIPKIVETLAASGSVALIGWSVAVVILLASIILVKTLMSIHSREMTRLVDERDKWQSKYLKSLKP